MKRRALVLAVLAFTPTSPALSACSCAGDETYGSPGVAIRYDEVVASHPGPLHVKACFGSVCDASDSGGWEGSRIDVGLNNQSSAANSVTLTITDKSGTVVLDTHGTYAVPSIHDKSMCGTSIWQLNLQVHNGALVPAPSSTYPPQTVTSH